MARPPSAGAIANRRLLTFLLAGAGILTFMILASRAKTTADYSNYTPKYSSKHHSSGSKESAALAYAKTPIHHVTVEKETLAGGAIMPKLGNETLKAELGRSAWKLFHTTMARFPEKPTEDEQTALFSYIHLFARLYPCGECAGHFRQILQKYPPQVSGRNKAAGWACFVHNEVNQSLGKPEFDCNNIGDFYDCGCAEDDEKKEAERGGAAKKGTKKASGGGEDEDEDEGSRSSTAAKAKSKPAAPEHKSSELMLEREGEQLGG